VAANKFQFSLETYIQHIIHVTYCDQVETCNYLSNF